MSPISVEEALERVRAAADGLEVEVRDNFGQPDATVSTADYVGFMSRLRDGEDLSCRFFTFLSAVDRTEFADEPGGIEVLVHVYSPAHVLHVNVHVPLEMEGLTCPSITSLYAGALWHERETSEMFGIRFDGHPHLVNLYLPEDFEGHPLRKSFRLPTRIVKDWPGAKDPEEAAAGGR